MSGQHLLNEENFYSKWIACIETTSRCNLKCKVCPQGQGDIRRDSDQIDPELLLKIIEDCGKLKMKQISFNVFNEPFTYREKHLRKACDKAAKAGMRIQISTNIALLEDWIYEYRPVIDATIYLGGSRQARSKNYKTSVKTKLPRLIEYIRACGNDSYIQALYGDREKGKIFLADVDIDNRLKAAIENEEFENITVVPQGVNRWAGHYGKNADAVNKSAYGTKHPLEVAHEELSEVQSCSIGGKLNVVMTCDLNLLLCASDPVKDTAYAKLGKEADNLYDLVMIHGWRIWERCRDGLVPPACNLCLKEKAGYVFKAIRAQIR